MRSATKILDHSPARSILEFEDAALALALVALRSELDIAIRIRLVACDSAAGALALPLGGAATDDADEEPPSISSSRMRLRPAVVPASTEFGEAEVEAAGDAAVALGDLEAACDAAVALGNLEAAGKVGGEVAVVAAGALATTIIYIHKQKDSQTQTH